MTPKHAEPCAGTTKGCYAKTLKQAMTRHLPCRLFDTGGVPAAVRWCERYLTLCALLMAWSVAGTLADRFDEARRGVTAMFRGRKRPGKSYQGFVAALGAKSEALLGRVADHL